MKSPVIYYFQIFIEIICRCLSVMNNKKQRSIIWKKFYIGSEAFCEKRQRTKDGTLTYSSIDIFPCRDLSVGLRMVFFPLKNPPKRLVNFSVFHFEVVCRWYHQAINKKKHQKWFPENMGILATKWVNPFCPSIAFHIGTIHLTGFSMKRNTGLKRVKKAFFCPREIKNRTLFYLQQF